MGSPAGSPASSRHEWTRGFVKDLCFVVLMASLLCWFFCRDCCYRFFLQVWNCNNRVNKYCMDKGVPASTEELRRPYDEYQVE